MGANSASGVARGVSDTGALKVMTEGGETLYNGGEISLRGAAR